MVLLAVCLAGLASCNRSEDIELIDSSYKSLDISCGSDFEIPVLSSKWEIQSVRQLPSNEVVLDKEGNPLALATDGTMKASNGWLALTRNGYDKFTLSLKENFDNSAERRLVISVSDGSHCDDITIVQRAGTRYKIVKSTFQEIEERRKIYASNKGCFRVSLSNNTSEAAWEPCDYIFEDVIETSIFESNDYEAFGWAQEGVEISVPELIINNAIRWNKYCTYKKGITTSPYIRNIFNGSKILISPYSTVHLEGEVTYCERMYNYTFTVQNEGSGTRFDINGTWKQIVPISDTVTSF